MADIIPPTPVDQPQTSFEWVDWYEKLRKIVNETEFFHNSLQGIQGGTSAERYHLTLAEKTNVESLANLDETIDDRVAALLVAGTNITLTYNDGAGTLTIAASGGGGGASWTEVEVDFGSTPVYTKEFTITDASITATSKVQVLPCGKAATGRTADDWLWDSGSFAANPGTGSATCYAVFHPGPIVGLRKIQYSIGT